MNQKVIKELQKLMALCIEINEKPEHTVFFDYAGHVDTFGVNINKNGWEKESVAKYLTSVGGDEMTVSNIKKCCKKLLKYKEW